MKNLHYILTVLLVSLVSFAFAQESESKTELRETEKKAAGERARSFGGKKTQSTLDGKKSQLNDQEKQVASDQSADKESTSNAENSDLVVKPNEDQNQSEETTGTNTDPDRSNSPAVIQTTTSESGSPAILSENNGEGRDGTNNRQRGTYKMAGVEMKGDIGLSKTDGAERNIKAPKKILKQEQQPALVRDGATTAEPTENVVPAEQTEEVVTDQPIKKEPKKEKPKSRKKSKRNRDRDSGR